jgi:hypothetical protein
MIANKTRVDEAELRQRIKQLLASQHFASFRKLDVTVVGDGIVLAGCVPSFHERQLAVALCQHVPGVHRVVDQLSVCDSSSAELVALASSGRRGAPGPRGAARSSDRSEAAQSPGQRGELPRDPR